MIAYLEKTRRTNYSTYALVICERPCNGIEYMKAERIEVSGKREANAICKARGLKAWNW